MSQQNADMDARKVTMFCGKGGVGKTTCAGATALHYAVTAGPTLAISTDATPSLSHIFEVRDTEKPARVLDGLFLAELGHAEVRRMWDRKFGRDMHEVFSSFVSVGYDEFSDFVASILPGLYDEFIVDYIRELGHASAYRHIVWDTAPLGQTLGLLRTPAMLREHLRPAPRIYSKLKLGKTTRKPVMDILKAWEALSGEDVMFLREGVRFVIVTIPEALAVEQLDGILADLESHGFGAEQLVVNNVIKDADSDFLRAKSEQQQGYLEELYRKYSPSIPIIELPLFPHEIKGLDKLRLVEQSLFAEAASLAPPLPGTT